MIMDTQKVHLLKLEKGDELLACILGYIKKNGIIGGYLTGIGALLKGKIGYFDIEKKQYINIPFQEVELLACTGNISKNKDTGESVAHIHIILGNADGTNIGGHLIEAIVSVTAEIYLVETRPGVYRLKDNETGLYLLSPKN